MVVVAARQAPTISCEPEHDGALVPKPEASRPELDHLDAHAGLERSFGQGGGVVLVVVFVEAL